MSKPKPFPAITGSCLCTTIRYRLLTSPLFCYACHCGDCQKSTGSAFGLFLNIEAYYIRIISPTLPVTAARERHLGVVNRHVECPKCKTELWSSHALGDGVCDVRVGTLDFPSLMEPDVHSFVESKVEWVGLPEGARTAQRDFDSVDMWPKSSLKRLEICKLRVAEAAKMKIKEQVAMAERRKESLGGEGEELDLEEASGEGEKTPTAVEFGEKEVEDDEAFEMRFRETEKALQERLEKLTLKLEEEDKAKVADGTTT